MGTRVELHQVLLDILGSSNVYYQPPESLKMSYPCIMYSLDGEMRLKASDSSYLVKKKYMVTIVDRNPDSEIPNKISELRYASFDRSYASDGLNHFVFTVYF